MKPIIVLLFFVCMNSNAQNTISLPENGSSPKTDGNRMYFEGFTLEKISDNEINIYPSIDHEDGSTEEVKFNYIRYKK